MGIYAVQPLYAHQSSLEVSTATARENRGKSDSDWLTCH